MTHITARLAPRRELIAWAMYDFANSGYTTVVLTAIFNAYFVGVIAAGIDDGNTGTGTLLWSVAVGIANLLILVTAPVLGAIADYSAAKKKILAFSTAGCILMTAMLGFADPGDIVFTMILLAGSAFLFGTGENLIAAFLPEISPPDKVGKVSGFSWALGYIGGMLVLALCLLYIESVKPSGQTAEQYVPVTLWITACVFLLAAMPTFLFLRERQQASAGTPSTVAAYVRIGFSRLRQTLRHHHQFRDLFRFLLALCIFSSGIYTVIVIATIYAQEVMHFTTTENIIMIMLVNITAAAGAFFFGMFQDRLGAKRTLELTLVIWILAIFIAWTGESRTLFWISANLIGLAMGSSQSAGRALVSLFTPADRSAEFFGLWGLSIKLAAILGPLSYGFIAWYSSGNHRLAILTTLSFFIVGLLVLLTVNEKRGRLAAAVGE
jgi:UMF1 family MFS transporter